MKKNLKLISQLLNLLIVCLVLTAFQSYRSVKELPDKAVILQSSLDEPVQTAVNMASFRFTYAGSDYQLIPHASYRINGMVITHNNVSGIGDAYHTSESVDLKDLCLLWGENAVNPYLKEIKFWSEPWTCVFHTNSQAAYESFRLDQISNNHLLAANDDVKKTIQKIKVGDQVQLEGLLVDYYPHGASEALRKTSLIREDTGNGACEVLYVENISITREWRPSASRIYQTSKVFLISLLAIKFITFLLFPWLEYKAM